MKTWDVNGLIVVTALYVYVLLGFTWPETILDPPPPCNCPAEAHCLPGECR